MIITQNPLLSAFSATVSNGTVHGAARELRLTQTAVTKRIRSLERELGAALFLRSRRGMSLTAEGRALFQLCKAGREIEGTFLAQIKGTGGAEISLTITGPTSAMSTRIADDCVALYSRHPNLRLHLLSDDSPDLIGSIRRGETDLAVVPPSLVPLEMESKVLRPDRYLLVASPKWKGRRLQDIVVTERVIDFRESDQTTRRYLEFFQLDRRATRSRLYVNENDALIRLFKAGVGFGTLTESVARPHLERGDLMTLNRGLALEDPLALAWYPRAVRPPYFSDLVRAVR